jgi:hypothetical protein
MPGALISYGPQVLSFSKTASLQTGTVLSGTVVGHTNGMLGIGTKANEITVGLKVDLGSSKTPDIAGVFNHNITSGIVRVQGSDDPNFSSLITNVVMTVASPNFWVDLRLVFPRTARYWQITVTSNANAVKVGEIIIAQVSTHDFHQWEYTDLAQYPQMDYGTTPYGYMVRRRLGFKIRSRQVRYAGIDAIGERIQAVSDYAGRYPGPVIWVPNDTVNDIWFLDWSDQLTRTQILDNRQEVKSFLLQEQSPGVL